MKRLFTLMLTASVIALTAPVAVHNAAAADAATSATDDAMKDNGDTGAKKKHHGHKAHHKGAHKAHHKKHIGPHHAKTTEEGKTIGSHEQPPADNGAGQ